MIEKLYVPSWLTSYGWRGEETKLVNRFWNLEAKNVMEAERLTHENLTREIEQSKRPQP